jgi:thiamine biosynthesis lipoprotein
MKIKRILQLLFLLFLVVGSIFVIRRHQTSTLQMSEGPIYGTAYHISYVYEAPLDSQIRRELLAVDSSLSMFNTESTISHINSGISGRTDSLLRDVYRVAHTVAVATDGAYDVTVGPLVNLWGFGSKQQHTVTAQQVDSVLAFVGYEKVKLVGDSLVKADPRIVVDFSSVAKGYAVDRVARLFDRLGIKDYMVEIGGEVVVKGPHPEGRPWKIGVTTPRDNGDSQDVEAVLTLTDMAMATSGNYRRFYEQDGHRYAHTIDPHTGYPVQHEVLSATVFAADCATADAYATAFMVVGLKKAQELLKIHPEIKAHLIYSTADNQYASWTSPAIEKYFR